MDKLIEYLEEIYTITATDLTLPDDERNFLLGQLSIISDIKDIHEKGYPKKDEEEI